MTDEKKAAWHDAVPTTTVLLLLVLVFGVFLRLYHFHDWLHFELDQARDARLVDDAFFNDPGGPGELPLLGMRAAGSSLRLAPGFYYLQYASALVFGMTPSGIALFVPILSALSVGLMYLFSRRFFSRELSLSVASLFSVSTFIVLYGRFAWNPNPLPFFSLAGFYSLLRAVDPAEERRGRFFVLFAFFLGLATNMHFLAFMAYPVVAIAFLLFRRPKFSLRVWIAAVFAAFVFYVPVLLNEFETGFANSKAFMESVTETSSEDGHSVAEKLFRDISEHGRGYLMLTTGYEQGDFPSMEWSDRGPDIKCDGGCRVGWKQVTVALGITFLGFLSAVFLWWKERGRRQSDMLLLSGIWFAVSFFLILPVSYDVAPRFFLLAAPIPFLLLGFLAEAARRLLPWKDSVRWATILVFALLVGSNLWYLSDRFRQLAEAPFENIETPPDRILKERTRFSLGHMDMIAGYLEERQKESGGWTVFMHSNPEYRRSLKYLLDLRGMENEHLGASDLYEEGIYVLILRAGSDYEDDMEKYLEDFDFVGKRDFGTMIMLEFYPKPEAVIGKRIVIDETSSVSSRLPRYTWREWWSRQNDPTNDDEDE